MCNLKRFSLLAASVSFLFIAGMLATPGYSAIDHGSIVGLWLLDESDDNVVNDISGNGHDGAIKGDPEWDEGKFGDALKFDGSGDVVDCGNAENLNLDTFTVSFWAKFEATQGWYHIVSKGDHVTSGVPGSVNWGVMMRDGEARFLFEIYQDTTWTGISSPAVGLDEWQHLTATYDGDRMEFFLNGVSLGSSTGAKVKLDSTRSFLIGARSSVNPAAYFIGSVDEVALFNEVLDLADIKSLMNEGIVEALNLTAVSPAINSFTTWARIKDRY